MSPNRVHQRIGTTPSVIKTGNRRRRFFHLVAMVGLVLLDFIVAVPSAHAGANFNLQNNPGGISLTTVGNNYTTSFGTMDALGINTSSSGVSTSKLSNGALYYTTYQLIVTGGLAPGDTGYVTAYVSSNFSNTSAWSVYSCPTSSSCNTSGNFSAMSTSSVAQTSVIAAPGIPKNQAVVAGLAIWVPDNNGAQAFTGTNSGIVITYTMRKGSDNSLIETLTLTLNANTLQKAVRLQLATATSGLTVATASDYSMNFGNVNGLGIGSSAGLTTSSQAGGIIYSTPYNLLPAFGDQTSNNGTIAVCVSTTFTHSAILKLEDSATGSSGSFSNIATSCSSPTSLTSSATDRSTITRYLGLFVSATNGASAFTGADTATLTFTLTVP